MPRDHTTPPAPPPTFPSSPLPTSRMARARRSADLRGRPLLYHRNRGSRSSVVTALDGADTRRSTDTRARSTTSAARSGRPVLAAARLDSNLSGGGTAQRRDLLPRSYSRSSTGPPTSLRPAIGNSGAVSRVRARVPPHLRFVTKSRGSEKELRRRRDSPLRELCVPAARNTYTRTERRRAPCMRVRSYLRIRGVYSHRLRGR